MIHFDVHFDVDLSTQAILEKFGLQDHGPAQMAIDNAIINYMTDYWAYDTGALANSARSASDIGSGIIVYDLPYAQMMVHGVSRYGTPINYNLTHNPLAGAYPFERMVADHSEDILQEVRNVASGGQ